MKLDVILNFFFKSFYNTINKLIYFILDISIYFIESFLLFFFIFFLKYTFFFKKKKLIELTAFETPFLKQKDKINFNVIFFYYLKLDNSDILLFSFDLSNKIKSIESLFRNAR
jgi:hypothetical protein